MNLKAAVKRMEQHLRLEDEQEVTIYHDIPRPGYNGLMQVIHISNQGTKIEAITREEYNRRMANRNGDGSEE